MQYAEVTTPTRVALITLEPTNFGRPYEELLDQTDVSGAEAFAAYSHDNFSNPFQQADEQRYHEGGWWGEIFRDMVRQGSGTNDKGQLNVSYVSHAGTEWEKVHDVWMPKNGWYVPIGDEWFHEGTLVPFETVSNRAVAMKRLEAAGIPPEQVSQFYRLDSYKDDPRFVGRDFGPSLDYDGRFGVNADRLQSSSGCDWVGSRPAYRSHEKP